jgi:large subunit ribosomal protein L36e
MKSGVAFGRNKGFQVTPLSGIERAPERREKLRGPSEGMRLAKAVISEICGLAPYEKKALDYVRRGEEKKGKKFLKKRLGSLRRAIRKQAELEDLLRK